MHVFLTGEVHVGKTTLLEKVLARLEPRRLCGLRTRWCTDGAGEQAVYLFPLGDAAGVKAAVRVGETVTVFPDAFDGAGTAALQSAETADLVLLDEVGRFEAAAEGYAARILALLDGSSPILGVVQQQAKTPLCDAIRSHERVTLVTVTEENRDELVDIILDTLQKPFPF